MKKHVPEVGDVYEYSYGTPGKRVRLFGREGLHFLTEVVRHDASPQTVGRVSFLRASRLTTSQFTLVTDQQESTS